MKARLLLTVFMAVFASSSHAGLDLPEPVTVDLVERLANGDLWSARFDDEKDDAEFIGCGIYTLQDGLGGAIAFAFCQARDVDENLAFCATQNPGLIEAIRAIADFSSITFRWDELGECTDIGSSTQSYFLNKDLER